MLRLLEPAEPGAPSSAAASEAGGRLVLRRALVTEDALAQASGEFALATDSLELALAGEHLVGARGRVALQGADRIHLEAAALALPKLLGDRQHKRPGHLAFTERRT